MPAIFVPAPPLKEALTDPSGAVSRSWRTFLTALYARAGGSADKIDAAHAAALAAAPRTARIVAVGGLHAGGDLSADVPVALYRAVAPAAVLPTAGVAEGDWAYAVDGRKTGEAAGAGTGVPAWFSGGRWFAIDSGAVVAT